MKGDMIIKGVNVEMTNDRREWKEKTCGSDPILWHKGTMMMTVGMYELFHPSVSNASKGNGVLDLRP
jgi:hypothetical protein